MQNIYTLGIMCKFQLELQRNTNCLNSPTDNLLCMGSISTLVPEFVFEVGDFPLLGFVVGDQVFELSLDFAPLGLFTRNFLLQFVKLAFEGFNTSVNLKRQVFSHTIGPETQ